MGIPLRSGSWLVALGVVLTGCGHPVNPPQKVAKSSVTNLEVVPGASQVVLTVEGMT